MRVGITGASGYIGRALVRSAPPNWQIVSLGRRPASGSFAHRDADLAKAVPDALLEGLDAVVHLAADTGGGAVTPEQEIAFARDLAQRARARDIPLLFLSSQAASVDAPTDYGRTKAAIETAILPLDAAVIRPGMVYGGEERGLFGMLCGTLRRSPVRPLLVPSPLVQPIHVDDLCAAIGAVIANRALHGEVHCIAGEPMGFNQFLAEILRTRVCVMRPPMPVPVPMLRFALQLAGRMLGPRLGPGRLDSLTRLPSMQTQISLQRVGLTPRDLRDGMSRSGSPRRRLLVEGRAFARSLLRPRVIPVPTLRRYVRALLAHDQFTALDLVPSLLAWPALLAALDRPAWRRIAPRGGVAWRMGLMYRLCESDPALASCYVRAGGNRMAALVDGMRAGAAELQAWLLRPLARSMVRDR